MNPNYHYRFVVKHSNYGLLKDFMKRLKNLRTKNADLLECTEIGKIISFMDKYFVLEIIDPRENLDELIHIEKVKDIALHKAKFNGVDSLIVDDPYYWPKFGYYDIAKDHVSFFNDESSFYDGWSFDAYLYYHMYIWIFYIQYPAWTPNVINDKNIDEWEKALYGIYKRIKIGKVGDFVCMRSLL